MTKSKPTTARSYEALKTELDAVTTELQRDALDVDVALAQYQRGLELVQQLEHYLATAENTVKELKAKFNTAGK